MVEEQLEYQVVTVRYSHDELEHRVNKLLKEGWTCQGGVFYTELGASRQGFWAQAMVKYDN